MSQSVHPYYEARKPVIVRDFLESLELAAPSFAQHLPEIERETLTRVLLEEMDRVLETLPYVGGDEGRMTPFFERNAGVIALGRVLRSRGIPRERIWTLMRKTYLAQLASLPEADRFALGREWLSPENQALLRVEAQKSVEQPYAGDFMYEYVGPGVTEEGDEYEFGLNYSQCGFCQLMKKGGDEDLLPAICAMDREVYAVRGVELFRTTTLAAGDSQCNFRFRALRPKAKEQDDV
jgi:hypothetical protein